jgi:hypothetical protein
MGAGGRPGLSLGSLAAVSRAHLVAAILGVRLQDLAEVEVTSEAGYPIETVFNFGTGPTNREAAGSNPAGRTIKASESDIYGDPSLA